MREQIFMGVATIGIGAFVLLSAALNWEWYFGLPKARRLEDMWGRTGARLFFVSVGVIVIALGSLILAGW